MLSILIPIALTLLYTGCTKGEEPLPDDEPKEEPQEQAFEPFANVPDTENMIMYQVNPKAFGPNGTLSNIESRLEHISNLGVNVIWIMPIFPQGEERGVGSPYSVRDYFDVNPDYGTLQDFTGFVAKAHELDIAVIIDWVANHTSWDNDWIYNEDWYMTDNSGNIIHPPGTNWQDVAQLDFDNYEMRTEMIKALKFWVEKCNIDGFRFDAVDFVPDSFWYQALDSLNTFENRNLILLAESGNRQIMNAGFHMLYGWDFQHKISSIFVENHQAKDIFTTHRNEYNNMPAETERLRYITNHDISAWEKSLVEGFGTVEASVTAFAITTLMGGVPLIYNGQEIGHPNRISFFELNPINWSINPDIYAEYQELIRIKKEYAGIIATDVITYQHNHVVAFSKKNQNDEILLLANVRNSTTNYTLPAEIANSNWVDLRDSQEHQLGTELVLEAHEYHILKRN
jgi:glycosidase